MLCYYRKNQEVSYPYNNEHISAANIDVLKTSTWSMRAQLDRTFNCFSLTWKIICRVKKNKILSHVLQISAHAETFLSHRERLCISKCSLTLKQNWWQNVDDTDSAQLIQLNRKLKRFLQIFKSCRKKWSAWEILLFCLHSYKKGHHSCRHVVSQFDWQILRFNHYLIPSNI